MPQEIIDGLGPKLKDALRNAQMSQEELAVSIKASPSSVSNWINGYSVILQKNLVIFRHRFFIF